METELQPSAKLMSVADALKRSHDQILQRWEKEARRLIPADAGRDKPALLDSLPLFIDSLELALRAHLLRDGRINGAMGGRKHGHQRFFLEGFTLEQVHLEYSLLRQIVFDEIRSLTEIDRTSSQIIREVFSTAIREAISEFSSLENEQRRHHQRYDESILGQLPVGVSIAEAPSGRLIYLNPEAIRLLRHPMLPTESYKDYTRYGAHHEDGTPYQPEEYPIARALLSGKKIAFERMRYMRGDGTTTLFSVTATPLMDETGQASAAVSLFTDISEQIEAERIVREEEKRRTDMIASIHDQKVAEDAARRAFASREPHDMTSLLKAKSELERFAAVAAHDLKSPLNSITQFIELLASDYRGRLSPEADEYMDFIIRAAHRMRSLIDDLLAYARLDSISSQTNEVDLDQVFDTVVQNLDFEIRRADAVVERGDLPRIQGNFNAMVQLFQNIIGNALKYRSPNRRPEIRVERQDRDSAGTSIAFHDNGIGMKESQANLAFEPFRRLHHDLAIEGTGLGLAICKRIVEQHGGIIQIDSFPERGTTVVIRFP